MVHLIWSHLIFLQYTSYFQYGNICFSPGCVLLFNFITCNHKFAMTIRITWDEKNKNVKDWITKKNWITWMKKMGIDTGRKECLSEVGKQGGRREGGRRKEGGSVTRPLQEAPSPTASGHHWPPLAGLAGLLPKPNIHQVNKQSVSRSHTTGA